MGGPCGQARSGIRTRSFAGFAPSPASNWNPAPNCGTVRSHPSVAWHGHSSKGALSLCGDAAHVMSPIGGQGMNIGFADAWHLAAVMRRLFQTHEPHASLFARYETDRRRACRIAANRAGRGMWLGTRTGRIPSACAPCVIRHALLRFPLSRHLPRYFAMLTIPNGLIPSRIRQPGMPCHEPFLPIECPRTAVRSAAETRIERTALWRGGTPL
jgi:hypothetical protein